MALVLRFRSGGVHQLRSRAMGVRGRGQGQEVMAAEVFLPQCSAPGLRWHGLFDLFLMTPCDSAIVVRRRRRRMDDSDAVIPMTALVVDQQGRLTYMAEDGRRRVIIGDPGLLRRIRQIQDADGDLEGGCGI